MTHRYLNTAGQLAIISFSEHNGNFTIFRTLPAEDTEVKSFETLAGLLAYHHELHWDLEDKGFQLRRY